MISAWQPGTKEWRSDVTKEAIGEAVRLMAECGVV